MNLVAVLHNAQQANACMNDAYQKLKPYLIAGHKFELRIRAARRTSAQNARMWAMLGEVAKQVPWHGRKLSDVDWKHMFTASLKGQDVVPNLEGTGFVVIGQSTSEMTGAEMSALMELMAAFGVEHGVTFKDMEEA